VTATSSPAIADTGEADLVLGRWRVVTDLPGASSASGLATVAACADAQGEDVDTDLVIVERLPRETSDKNRGRVKKVDPAARLTAFAERARVLAQARHLNVPGVREVSVGSAEVTVVSELVEGEVLSALDPASLPLAVRVRVLVDVLGALSALHGAGDGIVHGEVTPSNVIVGFDGSSRLARTLRLPERAARDVDTARGYVAPEILLGDASADHRADLYAVGILLWEALSGTRLFPDATRDKILTRQLAGDLPIATVPTDAPWAAPLASIAAKALAVNPEQRYASAAELAAAIRLVVQAKLAAPAQVAALVSTLAGDAILTRRTRLRAGAERVRAPLEVDLDPGDLVEVTAPPPAPLITSAPMTAVTPTPTEPAPYHELDRSLRPARAQSVQPGDTRRRGLAILTLVAAACVLLLVVAAVRGLTREPAADATAAPFPSARVVSTATPTSTAGAATTADTASVTPDSTGSVTSPASSTAPVHAVPASSAARPKPARPRPPRSSYEPLGI
jgi:serine/threonine-protein kinase